MAASSSGTVLTRASQKRRSRSSFCRRVSPAAWQLEKKKQFACGFAFLGGNPPVHAENGAAAAIFGSLRHRFEGSVGQKRAGELNYLPASPVLGSSLFPAAIGLEGFFLGAERFGISDTSLKLYQEKKNNNKYPVPVCVMRGGASPKPFV